MVGGHNVFPAYEIIVNGRVVYKYFPAATGPGAWNLGAAFDTFRLRVNIGANGSVTV